MPSDDLVTQVRAALDFEVTVYDDKFTVRFYRDGTLEALRYGKPWRDLTGDGLVLALAEEVHELRAALRALRGEP